MRTRAWAIAVLLASAVHASGNNSEEIKGVGIGIDVQSAGSNPLPSAGILFGSFGYFSYHARATVSHRSSDSTTFVRGGVGAGFIFVLLNFDLTVQNGPQGSAGMYWGLSAFIPLGYLIPEIFLGYQLNFSGSAENFLLAGLKGYFNFAALTP